MVLALQQKPPPELETYTTIQFHELAGIVQDAFLQKLQVSNLFCGDGWTKHPSATWL